MQSRPPITENRHTLHLTGCTYRDVISGDMIAYPPGPRPHRRRSILRTIWSTRRLIADPFGFVGSRFDQYGDTYHVDEGGGSHLYVTRDPDFIRDVLVTCTSAFKKQGGANDRLRPVLGNGLVTSDGELWKRQRKLMQPAFHRKTIATYAEHITAHADRVDWPDGGQIDVDSEMMSLTLKIVCKTLFDHDVETDTDEVAAAMEALRMGVQPELLPAWVPTPRRRRMGRAMAGLDRIIDELVARRKQEGLRSDLLSLLLDVEGGMSHQQLRDELVTLFLAGHETTSHAMTWTWYLLSQHPEVEERLHAEVDRVLGGRAPTVADLPDLPWTDAVIHESMRIYPPVYAVARVASEPVEVGGWQLEAGAQVLCWIYHCHHNPKVFEEPEAFRPERFQAPTFPKHAYIPFGSGARMCIGAGFAALELRLLLANLSQRYTMSLVNGHRVSLHPRVTLSPRNGMPMIARYRAPRTVKNPTSI